MRTLTTDGVTLTYPDLWAFCFSPCYVTIAGASGYQKAIVAVYNGYGAYNVEVALYGGTARVYISRYLQLLASAGLAGNRTTDCAFYVSLDDGTGATKVFDEQATGGFFIVWGSLAPVHRIGSVGAYAYDPNEVAFVRRLRWFKAFPFKASLFGAAGQTFKVRYDSNGYGTAQSFGTTNGYLDIDPNTYASAAQRMAVVKIEGSLEGGGTFDASFDYTFHTLTEADTITRLLIDNRTQGYYLRWLDPWGQLQYYLFAEGSRSVKASDGDAIGEDITYGGVDYGGGRRIIEKGRDESLRIAAVNVTPNELAYVETIATATICDLYRGKTAGGTEIWVPVCVDAGTFQRSEHAGMQDFEINVSIPSATPQTL